MRTVRRGACVAAMGLSLFFVSAVARAGTLGSEPAEPAAPPNPAVAVESDAMPPPALLSEPLAGPPGAADLIRSRHDSQNGNQVSGTFPEPSLFGPMGIALALGARLRLRHVREE
jgi:hypothetical protein